MRKRYALVGVGQRSRHFIEALLGPHAEHANLVALCDVNVEALEARARPLREAGAAFATYAAADFDRMVAAQRPDTVIVTTPDHTHEEYVCRAMEHGCGVVVEKPLAATAAQCQRILDVQRATGRTCRVALNYRYAPWNTTIKHLLVSGAIGQVVAVTMRKSLGGRRGASYFHRWHAEMKRSGGLLVHKGTHYFDLVNFFVGSVPAWVYARGGRRFFTAEAADRLGVTRRGPRCGECADAARCPFFHDVAAGPEAEAVVQARLAHGGYARDLCVFRPEADIPDAVHLVVEYESGTLLNYSFLAMGDATSEAVLFGTHGRMVITGPAIHVVPYYGEARDVAPPRAPGHHGGADPIMFDHLFSPSPPPDPLRCAADHHAGAWAALVGLAANESLAGGRPVRVRDLVSGLRHPDYAEAAAEPADFDAARMRAWMEQGG